MKRPLLHTYRTFTTGSNIAHPTPPNLENAPPGSSRKPKWITGIYRNPALPYRYRDDHVPGREID